MPFDAVRGQRIGRSRPTAEQLFGAGLLLALLLDASLSSAAATATPVLGWASPMLLGGWMSLHRDHRSPRRGWIAGLFVVVLLAEALLSSAPALAPSVAAAAAGLAIALGTPRRSGMQTLQRIAGAIQLALAGLGVAMHALGLGDAAPLGAVAALAHLLLGGFWWLRAGPDPAEQRITRRCAAMMVGIGIVAMLGWSIDDAVLVQAGTVPVPMQFNTALAAVLAGTSLLLLSAARRAAALVLQAPIVLLAVSTLAEEQLGVALGLGDLLVGHGVVGEGALPGRMAPNTAAALLFGALAIAVAPRSAALSAGRWAATWACGVIVSAFAAIVLLGYMFGMPALRAFGLQASMALWTGVMLVAYGLGLGFVGSRPRQDRWKTAWGPLLVAIVTMVVTLLAWQALGAEHERATRALLREQAHRIRVAIDAGYALRADAVRRMAERIAPVTDAAALAERFAAESHVYLRDFGSFSAIALLDRSQRVVQSVPGGIDAFEVGRIVDGIDGNRIHALADDTSLPLLLSDQLAFDREHGGQLMLVPLIGGERFDDKFLAVAIDHRRLLGELLTEHLPPTPLRLARDGRLLVEWQPIDGRTAHREQFEAGGLALTLDLAAPAGTDVGQRLATALLAAGLIAAGLLALALRMTALARIRARAAERASTALRQQIDERQRAEAALSASQREIVDVLESISDAVLLTDPDWRVVYLNPHAESLLRHDRDSLVGTRLWQAFPEAEEVFRPILERAVRDRVAVTLEEYFAPLQAWFDARVYPHARGLAIYFREVTELKRQQLKLEQSKMLLKIAGRSARLGGWAVDLASDRVLWSDEVCEIHQVPAGTSPGVAEAIEYYVPADRERIRRLFTRCATEGSPWDDEFELITASGKRLWVRAIGLARRDAEGAIVGVHGALQDISERKQGELELRRAAQEKGAALESLRQVMDSAVDIIAVLDAEQRFVLANAATEPVWGYRPDELVGRSIAPLVHPDDIDATRKAVAEVLAGRAMVDFRNRALGRDGRVVWMQWSARWSDRTGHAYCVARDCTAEHRTEQLEAGQRDILTRIAGGEALHDSLTAMAHLYEAQYDGAICSVMLLDGTGQRLRVGAAPSLPDGIVAALDQVPVGEACGVCGTAAWRGERVIVEDVATDPICAGYGSTALAHGLHACWGSPVRSSGGQVLAVLVVYYRAPAVPGAEELRAMDRMAALAAVAIEHAASSARIVANSERLQRLAAVGVALNRSIGQPVLYQQLVDGLREIIGAQMAVLSLTDGEQWQRAMMTVSLADRHAGWRGFHAEPTGAGIYREVVRDNRSLRLTQAELEAHPAFRRFSGHGDSHPPLRGLLAVPLPGSDGCSLGVLQLSDKNHGEFDEDDQAIAQQFAQMAATALERTRLIERLRERDRFFEMSLELFCVYDPAEQRFLQVNPAFVELLGYTGSDLTGRPCIDFVHPDDREIAQRNNDRMCVAHDELVGFTIRYVAADGSTCWLEWAGSSDSSGRYYLVARNITERRRIELERDYAESHDAQTGLPRYPVLEVALADMLDRGLNPSVFYIDIDRLHGINESMGHAVGDEALRNAAARLRGVVGDPERLARFAGDEFVAVVPGLDRDEAIALAERLRQSVSEPVEGGGYRVYLTASIGIARAPQHGDNARELLRRAEAAMTQAKQQGRDNVCEFSADRMQQIEDRRVLGSRLRDAIGAGELSLFYQPRVRASDRRVIGFEALARWDSAELGSVPPDRFVPTAEALGLMPELGHWVLQQACRQIRCWLEQGHRDFSVAVNVSAHQLQRPELVEQVRGALAAERIPPHMLDLELTESALMENVERVQTKLAELKQLGVSLSLDDFGTGYSSLAYLKQFSLDKLKIDRRFVRDLPHGAHDVAIARTIVAMAHQLKLAVSAEGVEQEDQASFLRDIGCDELQGYWFGRPLPAERAGELFGSG